MLGALSGKFVDYGIADNFIEQTREKVTEGTSALFLSTTAPVVDKVVEALNGQNESATAFLATPPSAGAVLP